METGARPADGLRGEAGTEESRGPSPVTVSPCHPVTLSRTRAWFYLVWLSCQRQARARQMVWISLGLLFFSVVFVAGRTAAGDWTMARWRFPYRHGPTASEWADVFDMLSGVIYPSPGAHAAEALSVAALRAVLQQSGFLIFTRYVVFAIFLTFLLPLWSLSFATEAVGGERESNSLIWLLTRPLPRPAIYLAKFVALLPWSVGLNVVGFALICLAAGGPGKLAFSLYWPAVVWATLAFSALFCLIGAYFRRPAVVALVYSFFLEVVFGNMPGYLKRISIGFYTRCMMYEAAQDFGVQPEKPSIFLPVDGTTALFVLITLTVGLLALGVVVFSRTEYHEVSS
jgi:ABC-2 type transport system permease protein